MNKFRFGIRTLLVAMICVSVLIGWSTNNLIVAKKENAIIEQLEKSSIPSGLGQIAIVRESAPSLMCGTGLIGIVTMDSPTWPNRLGATISPSLFERVTTVSLIGASYTDESILNLCNLRYLNTLECSREVCSVNTWDSFSNLRPDVVIEYTDEADDVELERGDPFASDSDPFNVADNLTE